MRYPTSSISIWFGLPSDLGALCEVLGVPLDKAKNKEDKALIQLFCKPRPKNLALRRATSKTSENVLLLTQV
ncbi:hypothetical protein V5094_07945 [Moellerella wisconsensis]|uniref:Uncharacterized protein n=1 Tax=Moellerella wisconsensis TaxID=158849 RepID=A0A9Q8PYN3_9GAMM|nr:hypothetical protein [Moellerella wisconsensis]UNH29648.1 hypothetical protein MNY72_09660 [Moellerella wisconsensis]UNH41339.1 hypothetical protein MNY66_09685 [Moellerella wisconsensis]